MLLLYFIHKMARLCHRVLILNYSWSQMKKIWSQQLYEISSLAINICSVIAMDIHRQKSYLHLTFDWLNFYENTQIPTNVVISNLISWSILSDLKVLSYTQSFFQLYSCFLSYFLIFLGHKKTSWKWTSKPLHL